MRRSRQRVAKKISTSSLVHDQCLDHPLLDDDDNFSNDGRPQIQQHSMPQSRRMPLHLQQKALDHDDNFIGLWRSSSRSQPLLDADDDDNAIEQEQQQQNEYIFDDYKGYEYRYDDTYCNDLSSRSKSNSNHQRMMSQTQVQRIEVKNVADNNNSNNNDDDEYPLSPVVSEIEEYYSTHCIIKPSSSYQANELRWEKLRDEELVPILLGCQNRNIYHAAKKYSHDSIELFHSLYEIGVRSKDILVGLAYLAAAKATSTKVTASNYEDEANSNNENQTDYDQHLTALAIGLASFDVNTTNSTNRGNKSMNFFAKLACVRCLITLRTPIRADCEWQLCEDVIRNTLRFIIDRDYTWEYNQNDKGLNPHTDEILLWELRAICLNEMDKNINSKNNYFDSNSEIIMNLFNNDNKNSIDQNSDNTTNADRNSNSPTNLSINGSPQRKAMIEKTEKFIVDKALDVEHHLHSTADVVNHQIENVGEQIKSHLEPTPIPWMETPRSRVITKTYSGSLKKASQKVVDITSPIAMRHLKEAVISHTTRDDHYHQIETQIETQTTEEQAATPKDVWISASKAGISSIGAAVIVKDAVASSTSSVLKTTATVTADVVEHKYGPNVGQVVRDSTETVGNIFKTITNFSFLTGKHTHHGGAGAVVRNTEKFLANAPPSSNLRIRMRRQQETQTQINQRQLPQQPLQPLYHSDRVVSAHSQPSTHCDCDSHTLVQTVTDATAATTKATSPTSIMTIDFDSDEYSKSNKIMERNEHFWKDCNEITSNYRHDASKQKDIWDAKLPKTKTPKTQSPSPSSLFHDHDVRYYYDTIDRPTSNVNMSMQKRAENNEGVRKELRQKASSSLATDESYIHDEGIAILKEELFQAYVKCQSKPGNRNYSKEINDVNKNNRNRHPHDGAVLTQRPPSSQSSFSRYISSDTTMNHYQPQHHNLNPSTSGRNGVEISHTMQHGDNYLQSSASHDCPQSFHSKDFVKRKLSSNRALRNTNINNTTSTTNDDDNNDKGNLYYLHRHHQQHQLKRKSLVGQLANHEVSLMDNETVDTNASTTVDNYTSDTGECGCEKDSNHNYDCDNNNNTRTDDDDSSGYYAFHLHRNNTTTTHDNDSSSGYYTFKRQGKLTTSTVEDNRDDNYYHNDEGDAVVFHHQIPATCDISRNHKNKKPNNHAFYEADEEVYSRCARQIIRRTTSSLVDQQNSYNQNFTSNTDLAGVVSYFRDEMRSEPSLLDQEDEGDNILHYHEHHSDHYSFNDNSVLGEAGTICSSSAASTSTKSSSPQQYYTGRRTLHNSDNNDFHYYHDSSSTYSCSTYSDCSHSSISLGEEEGEI